MNLHRIVLAPAEAVRGVFRCYGFTGIRSKDHELFVLSWQHEQEDQDRPSVMLHVPAELLPNGQFRIDAAQVSFAGKTKVTFRMKRQAWLLLRQCFSLIDHQYYKTANPSFMN
ncbi:hypothetical protein [Paenibacillus aquistagni]|uniref:Uncharacterized protein n=1 Tax=Paenibacillus aquistagni TaxID=1852522 RepID=A0A1X7LQ23_9BACL|nr:hypothetical protein [Paenibacillus aquistagni]NMM53233.1 hypothetical protein [Paenibacillus aquistagni]SMG55925.1 hypothetical protein SAMN06295960_4046 [Paenibacillus aquistagni]